MVMVVAPAVMMVAAVVVVMSPAVTAVPPPVMMVMAAVVMVTVLHLLECVRLAGQRRGRCRAERGSARRAGHRAQVQERRKCQGYDCGKKTFRHRFLQDLRWTSESEHPSVVDDPGTRDRAKPLHAVLLGVESRAVESRGRDYVARGFPARIFNQEYLLPRLTLRINAQ